jgi:uncharacterized protein YpmB
MHYKKLIAMNKKIIIGIAVGVVIIVATIGIKSIMGEKIELPAEEHTEKALNLQENNQSQLNSQTGDSAGNESGSSESTESRP